MKLKKPRTNHNRAELLLAVKELKLALDRWALLISEASNQVKLGETRIKLTEEIINERLR